MIDHEVGMISIGGRSDDSASRLRLNLRIFRTPHLIGSKCMYRNDWIISAVCLTLLFGCTTLHKPSPAEVNTDKRSVKSADGLIKGEVIGTPAPGSKFDKLQIGMSLEQVEKLIGQPNDTDSRITGKQYQPFYFGGDTQRTEAFYKGEGQLTFSNRHPDSAADTLIRIMVNPNATGSR
jgi:hypothetical protein